MVDIAINEGRHSTMGYILLILPYIKDTKTPIGNILS